MSLTRSLLSFNSKFIVMRSSNCKKTGGEANRSVTPLIQPPYDFDHILGAVNGLYHHLQAD